MQQIAVISATAMETAACRAAMQDRTDIQFLYTGVGMLAATYALMDFLGKCQPRWLIMAGVAGCFDVTVALGSVAVVRAEIPGSCGVAENGIWHDMADMGFRRANDFPYAGNRLINPYLPRFADLPLPLVDAVTVDEITTEPQRRAQLIAKYRPTAESMEGAALHYIGLQRQVPFLQLRSFSNYVCERDKSRWQLQQAVDKLNDALIDLLSNHPL